MGTLFCHCLVLQRPGSHGEERKAMINTVVGKSERPVERPEGGLKKNFDSCAGNEKSVLSGREKAQRLTL